MRNAPSVTYPVGRSAFSAVLRAVLWSAGAAALAGWIATQQVDTARTAAAVFALVACGAWAAWSWRREPAGMLAWDGARWLFTAPGREEHGVLRPALDLQSVLLVRWSARESGWLWLDRRSDPQRWDALRRAVHSPPVADHRDGTEATGRTP